MEARSRREFLEYLLSAAAATALPACSPPAAETKTAEQEKEKGKGKDKLRVGVIGLRGYGRNHVRAWKKRKDVEVAYLCDVDLEVGQLVVGKEFGRGDRPPKLVHDMRRIFDDKDVDFVSIATPHHWHALAAVWAMQAGKDVYVEKPVGHNVREGQILVAAARKYDRIVQSGLHRRSHGVVEAMVKHIRDGKLGKVSLAHCLTFKRRPPLGPAGVYPAPESVKLDLWFGPAEKKPITRQRFHYDWHWFWDYGNGAVGNTGIHRVDIARWAMGLENVGTRVISFGGRFGEPDAGETPNSQISIHTFDDSTIVHQARELPTGPYKRYKDGVVFFGTEGVIAYTGSNAVRFDNDGALEKVFTGKNENHFGNFVRAVKNRERERLNAEVQDGHVSSALCHVANISYRLGEQASEREILKQLESVPTQDNVRETLESFKAHLADNDVDLAKTPLTLGPWLKLDPATDSPVEPEAEPYLTRNYRAPFLLPEIKAS